MKTYNIYDQQTNEKLGEVEARNIIEAEIIGSKFGSDPYHQCIYALTKED